MHESAILKKKTLGAQGYVTDFEAQVEYANHPERRLRDRDARAAIASFPRSLSGIARAGVRPQHYVGEITDVAQPITHGGLSAAEPAQQGRPRRSGRRS